MIPNKFSDVRFSEKQWLARPPHSVLMPGHKP